MKKSVKNVLATLSVSALIAGSSLPLMAADKPADKPEVKPAAAEVKPVEAAKIKDPKGNPSCKVVKNASPIKVNKEVGKKCAGMKPATQVKEAAPSK